ncbi:unnamed protein product, partial [Schistosoma turkestanicum]
TRPLLEVQIFYTSYYIVYWTLDAENRRSIENVRCWFSCGVKSAFGQWENTLICPLNICTALGIFLCVSGNNTKSEMLRAMQLSDHSNAMRLIVGSVNF